MANPKAKTEHAGAKNGGGHWGTREEAKSVSKKLRRHDSKKMISTESSSNIEGKNIESNKTRRKPRIELAPQNKQKLTEQIEAIFLKRVFDIEGALITDECYLSDFMIHAKDRAIRSGEKPGTMVFQRKFYSGPKMSILDEQWRVERKKPQNWTTEEFETEPGASMAEIIAKVKDTFGVDIAGICKKPFVDILKYIAENYQSGKSKS